MKSLYFHVLIRMVRASLTQLRIANVLKKAMECSAFTRTDRSDQQIFKWNGYFSEMRPLWSTNLEMITRSKNIGRKGLVCETFCNPFNHLSSPTVHNRVRFTARSRAYSVREYYPWSWALRLHYPGMTLIFLFIESKLTFSFHFALDYGKYRRNENFIWLMNLN